MSEAIQDVAGVSELSATASKVVEIPSGEALAAMAAGRPGVVTAGPAPAAPEKPKNAIQVLESEIVNFMRQREQAVANVHAIDGAIQAAQHILARLRAEAAKAEALFKKAAVDVEAEGKKVATAVETEVKDVVREVKSKI